MMKENVIVLNFARDTLVDEAAMVEALKAGKVRKYVVDSRIRLQQAWRIAL